MSESPRLLWGAASPRLVVVAPVGSPAGRAHRREARIFSLTALVLGLVYLIWLGRLVLASRGSSDIFFFAAESLSYLLLCLLSYSTWRLRSPRLGNPESQPRFSVDILVPCCGEPLEIIKTTLKAVWRITYHPLEVYVLDDGASEAVAALAQSRGRIIRWSLVRHPGLPPSATFQRGVLRRPRGFVAGVLHDQLGWRGQCDSGDRFSVRGQFHV